MNVSAALLAASLTLAHVAARAEISIVTERNQGDAATAAFNFKKVPAPTKNDAAAQAKFTLVDGTRDRNGGNVDRLHDGRVASSEDQPSACFFFAQGSDGGRFAVDLGSPIAIKQVNSYSWHAATRGPQVYRLFASDGSSAEFKPEPKRDTDPAKAGWTLVATVDTRPKDAEMGGQYGVSISDSSGAIGKYRYLLFDTMQTESNDPFGNTFYTEIDVIDQNGPAPIEVAKVEKIEKTFEAGDGKYKIVMDVSDAPDLADWAFTTLAPVAVEWYPKLVQALPSDGFAPPRQVTIAFKDGMGRTPAATGGARVSCNTDWFRGNLKGEAKGAVIHELVHVVQQYGWGRRNNPGGTRPPGWLTEGIPDYLRWYQYEPESHGAEISKRRLPQAKYDASYRVTANFLNWVTAKYDKDLVKQINAALRGGKYSEEVWKTFTGHTVQELGEDWHKELEKKVATQG